VLDLRSRVETVDREANRMDAARHGRAAGDDGSSHKSQSGVAFTAGDHRCLRCRERVAPSGNTQPDSGTLFVCFTCVDELRRPGDRGWQWLRNRLGLPPTQS